MKKKISMLLLSVCLAVCICCGCGKDDTGKEVINDGPAVEEIANDTSSETSETASNDSTASETSESYTEDEQATLTEESEPEDVTEADENDGETEETENSEETVIDQEPAAGARIKIKASNVNVRDYPGTGEESQIVGKAQSGEVYEILEVDR